MKKIFFTILTALLIFAISASTVFAMDAPTDITPEISEDNSSEKNTQEEPSVGFFGEIYEEIAENSDKILSALTLVGSIIIAFAYKKGLLPLLNSALCNMNAMISALKEKTEHSLIENESISKTIKEKLAASEEVIETLSESIARLEAELKCTSETKREAENAKIIMNSQIDMLYEIFMSSSLPQYSKDRVGEKIAEMKAQLTNGED